MSLIMADLDLLREINNTYGHLAGDAVLKGIAEVFRAELRHYDVPARFGGEEFSILLPETPPEQALEIAERIRRAVAERLFDVETSSEPIRATVSIGVAGYPKDAQDPNALIHQADLAVYRAKLQGRNRVLGASSEPLLMPADRSAAPRRRAGGRRPPRAARARPGGAAGAGAPPHGPHDQRPALPPALDPARPARRPRDVLRRRGGRRSAPLFGTSTDVIGLLAVIALVGVGEALALELDDGSISVSAVGALAGAALFGPRAALAIAVTICVVQWSAQRQQIHRVLFNIGTLALSSLAAASVFMLGFDGGLGELVTVAAGLVAGAVYFAVNTGLLSIALAVEGRENVWRVWHERFLWLAPHYVVYGFIGGVIAIGYARGRPLRAGGLRGAAAADAQDAGGVPLAHAQERPEAAPGRGDDPHAERLARAGQPAAEGALDRGDGEPLGHRRRARRVHRRPLAPRPAARARDRPRARPLARRARPARPRRALPRHRQARDPGLDPAEAREPDGGGVGADAAARRRGRPHHRPARLPRRRGAGDPPPPRALRRHRLPRPARAARRSRSARASSTSRTRSTRC